MTISSSLNASVAGLAANASRLATISDNIANSATNGYRRVETDFHSMVIANKGGTYSAGGVRTTHNRLIDQGGSLISTSNPTDLAVRGRGFLPVAAITFSFISLRIFVICSAPADATATVDPPSASESSTALKPATSDSITLEIAQMAELSFAVPIVLPVEISFCVCARSELMLFKFYKATIADVFVRILDMHFSYLVG